MRRLIAPLAAVVLLALGLGGGSVRAASAPPPTQTPVATPTPYPTYTPAPAPTATHHPTLALSASQGMPDTPLVVVGADFPDGQVTLYWDGAYLARGTSADSYAHIDARVPATGAAAALGPHELRAVGPDRTSASAFFTIAQTYHPTIKMTPSHAMAMTGTVVTVDVSGFAPGQTVNFSWDRASGAPIFAHGSVADDNGDTSADLILGTDPAPGVGTHRLYASGTTPTLSASASFTVDPPPPACGGLSIPIPFSAPFCFDPFGWAGSWLRTGATAGADAIGAQVATVLTTQQDYTRIAELQLVFGTMQDFARDLFGVLFLAGATAWYARRLGLGPGGEAATQMVEGGLGLALTTALPGLMHLYIVAVNGASTMILADPHHTQGAATIGLLVSRLISGDLVAVIAVNPVFLGVIVGFVVAFFVLLVLIAITRTIGTMYGAAVYMAAPVCAICMVTPLTRGVAVAWARLWFSLTLWGVSYAVALVAVRAMLAVFAHTGGLQSLAAALAGALVLYGAPRLGDALLGGGASRALGIGHAPLVSNAVNTAAGAAFGGAIGALGGTLKGTGGTDTAVPATPGNPSIVQMPNASVTEISPAAATAAPINAEWGLIE